MNALPEGDWHLEVSDDNGSEFVISEIVRVKPLKETQIITLRLKKRKTIKFEGIKKTFPLSPKEARRRIEEMGFNFTEKSFEERILNGNDKVVALFLNAGMSPSVFTKSNDLISRAISHPRVLKSLLEAGADINGKSEDGFTPLLYAAGWSIIPIETVKMLLDAGADVTTKDAKGNNALYYVQINDDRPDVIKLIKSYFEKTSK
jgi:hypothetical protein